MKTKYLILSALISGMTLTAHSQVVGPFNATPGGQTPANPAGQTPANPAGQTPANPAGQTPTTAGLGIGTNNFGLGNNQFETGSNTLGIGSNQITPLVPTARSNASSTIFMNPPSNDTGVIPPASRAAPGAR
jgi:hypothetical protein